MTSRAKAQILGLVLPDFPSTLAPGMSLEVALRIVVNDDGHVDSVHVTTPPSSVDAEVIGAVAKWYLVPAHCGNSGWTGSEVRTSVAFGWEGDRKFVTVKDPRWYAVGEQVEVPDLTGLSGTRAQYQIGNYVEPEYPRALLRRGTRGLVVARFRVDDQGRIGEVLRVFSWPNPLFGAAVQSAMSHWKIERVDRECRSAELGCFEDKMMMADILIERFRPMRERAAELRSRPETIREILAAGADAARLVAKETMEEVREAMSLWQTKRGRVTA
jgi:hypothetical protein